MSRRQRSLPLHIETGRFKGKKISDYLCVICNSRHIENEYHFLCKCVTYNSIRRVLYNNAENNNNDFRNLNNEDIFVYVIKDEWKLVSNYVEKAWNIRNDIIYKHKSKGQHIFNGTM